MEGGNPDLSALIEKMDNVLSGESSTSAGTSNGQKSSTGKKEY